MPGMSFYITVVTHSNGTRSYYSPSLLTNASYIARSSHYAILYKVPIGSESIRWSYSAISEAIEEGRLVPKYVFKNNIRHEVIHLEEGT